MIKKLIFLFLLWPSLALADPHACISGEEVTELTNQYRELPFVRGVTSEGNSVVVFANPATGSFTILERQGANTYCALAVGAGFEPVPKSIQDEIQELQNQGAI